MIGGVDRKEEIHSDNLQDSSSHLPLFSNKLVVIQHIPHSPYNQTLNVFLPSSSFYLSFLSWCNTVHFVSHAFPQNQHCMDFVRSIGWNERVLIAKSERGRQNKVWLIHRESMCCVAVAGDKEDEHKLSHSVKNVSVSESLRMLQLDPNPLSYKMRYEEIEWWYSLRWYDATISHNQPVTLTQFKQIILQLPQV